MTSRHLSNPVHFLFLNVLLSSAPANLEPSNITCRSQFGAKHHHLRHIMSLYTAPSGGTRECCFSHMRSRPLVLTRLSPGKRDEICAHTSHITDSYHCLGLFPPNEVETQCLQRARKLFAHKHKATTLYIWTRWTGSFSSCF